MTDGFTEIALQLLRDAQFRKRLDVATHIGQAGDEGAGDYVIFEIYAPNGAIEDIGYKCNGCPTTMASCEIAAKLLLGKSISLAEDINSRAIDAILGQVAEGKEHISEFVVGALRRVQIVGSFENERVNA